MVTPSEAVRKMAIRKTARRTPILFMFHLLHSGIRMYSPPDSSFLRAGRIGSDGGKVKGA
jgi:hypothetical protein